MNRSTAKPICFYLPQFHRIPENDRWWGDGFTEWTLVRSAKPLFTGHAQPVVPHGDIGYYDLTAPGVRRRQGEMARQYGIHGFCYYHYWFGGTRLLHTPLELMLEDGQPDLPFCLCWANEPWSRRWSGESRDVLQEQVYGAMAEWTAHFEELTRFFDHPNYIRVDGQPVFLVYRIGHVDDAGTMIAHWRRLAESRGYRGLHIVAVEGAFDDNRIVPGYVDAVAEHHPSCVLAAGQPLVHGGLNVAPVEELWQLALSRRNGPMVRYRGACHAWDNTPRRGRDGYVVLPSRPARYARHLATLFENATSTGHQPFVFLNAWNEWSEGAHLEPDEANGCQWLECIDDALNHRTAKVFVPGPVSGSHGLPADGAGWSDDFAPVEPDVDLINTFMMHGVKAGGMLHVGCASGVTAQRLGWFAGADCVVGLEANPRLAGQARERLDEVMVVDPDAFDGSRQAGRRFDLLVCGDLLARVRDPRRLLEGMRRVMDADGQAWFCFEHSGHHTQVRRMLSIPGETPGASDAQPFTRRFTVAQARASVIDAGYLVEKIYRVFTPRPAGSARPRARGNTVTLSGVKLAELTGEQVDSLFCLKFFILACPDPQRAAQSAPQPAPRRQSFMPRLSSVERTISPHDSLYNVYAQQGSVEDYFASAMRQVDLLDELLSKHCDAGMATVDSIGDYACHYGRLLRAMRAARPDVALYAYDIDPDAVSFCHAHFDCTARVIGWDADAADDAARHDLLTSISLLTHTGLEFFSRVLASWAGLLRPGGLMCFTYLGAGYIERWRRGMLDHYGPVDGTVRERKIRSFHRDGHVLAGFSTLYSSDEEYGVGFMDEAIVREEVARHRPLEYLGTIGGDDNAFNQDLAVVRRTP